MTKPRFFITDVFTKERYGGNPLATFVDCDSLDKDEMQQIAKEINFSETTFITSTSKYKGGYDVRIFTPNTEVEFAGHPTLGTAFIIREKLKLDISETIKLNLQVGQIPVTFNFTSEASELWMEQPAPTFGGQVSKTDIANALGISDSEISDQFPIEEVSTGFPTLIVPLKSEEALNRVAINKEVYFDLVNEAWAKVILVFFLKDKQAPPKITVRVFGDYYGIPEDAATGSSNGSLAAYLAQHRLFGTADIHTIVSQGHSMGRPSTLILRTTFTKEKLNVFVGGSVIEVAQGVWG